MRAGSAEAKHRQIVQTEPHYQKEASELSQLLLGPIAEHIANKRLLIVSDGALQYVPFSALTLPQPARAQQPETADSTFVPLLAVCEIVRLTSASVLAVLRREASERRPAPKAVVAFADPIFDAMDPRVAAIRKVYADRGSALPAPASTSA